MPHCSGHLACNETTHPLDYPNDQLFTVELPGTWMEAFCIPQRFNKLQLSPDRLRLLAAATQPETGQSGCALTRFPDQWQTLLPGKRATDFVTNGGVHGVLLPSAHQRIKPPVVGLHKNKEWDKAVMITKLVMKAVEKGFVEKKPVTEKRADTLWQGKIVKECYAQIFTQPKSDPTEDPRMLADNKKSTCNASQAPVHHKMMDIRDAKLKIIPGDLLGMWDYENWFHQVTKAMPLRRMVRFRIFNTDTLQVEYYQYKSLSQGERWSTVLAGIMNEAPLTHLELHSGLRRVTKVDDNVMAEQTPELYLAQGAMAMLLLGRLGFVMKVEKTEFTLTHRIKFHGMWICSVAMVVFLGVDKLTKAVQLTLGFKELMLNNKAKVTPTQVAQVNGFLRSTAEAVPEAMLCTIELKRLEDWMKRSSKFQWRKPYAVSRIPVELKQAVIQEMEWWHTKRGTAYIHWRTLAKAPKEPSTNTATTSAALPETRFHGDQTILQSQNKEKWTLTCTSFPYNGSYFGKKDSSNLAQTDACDHSYGLTAAKTATYPAINLTQVWEEEAIDWHITRKESNATSRGIKLMIALRKLSNTSLTMQTDNICSRRYNSRGGRLHYLSLDVKEAKEMCRAANIDLTVEYLPGVDMDLLADIPSRVILCWREWKLNYTLFQAISTHQGKMAVDMFSQTWNYQLPLYITKSPADTKALACNAWNQDWGLIQRKYGKLFIHPPPDFKKIWRVLDKIQQDGVTQALVLVPARLNILLRRILQMAVEIPFIIQTSRHTILPPKAYTSSIDICWKSTKKKDKYWYKVPANRCLIGVTVAGNGSSSAAFRSSLHQRLGPDTRRELVRLLMRCGGLASPTWQNNRDVITFCSTILL